MSAMSEFAVIESARGRCDAPAGEILCRHRMARAKAAFTTRRVPRDAMRMLLDDSVRPQAGDLMLARVDRIRQHARLELADGRRAHMYPGDEIVVCAGNRYAPDQFHAVVPERPGKCSLVAAGGIAARVLERHSAMKPATEITTLGVLAGADGRRLNVARFALAPRASAPGSPVVAAVLGTSMNSGKTATAVHLVHGLSRAGRRVASAKITGTGAGGDVWRARDAGAEIALDFTDAGHASTYCLDGAAIERIFETLLDELAWRGVDAVVVEVADGLLNVETSRLAASASFKERVDHVAFAASDAMGAIAGSQQLLDMGLPLRLVSGAMTQSPIAVREAVASTPVPVVGVDMLADPAFAVALLGGLDDEAAVA